jgi:hypothetical protein
MDNVLRAFTALAAALALTLLGAPSAALASGHIVAPGDPGSSQYQEDIPTASGSKPVKSIHPPTAKQVAAVVPAPVAQKLGAQGVAGQQTAALAVQTASPTPATSVKPAKGATHGQLLATHVAATATVLTSALFGAGGGIGALLPILLAVSLVLALLVALRRRGS